jgi:uncharacterized protein YcnI
MNVRNLLVAAVAAAALTIVPAAAAHVTVNPDEVPADGFSRFAIRVPTERGVATTKVTVELPEGLFFVSFQPKPGWKRTVQMEQLDEPVELFGEQVTERVASVTWEGGEIGPGEFDEFGLSAKVPDAEGETLVFPALQTYASGEVVRWIGPADADEPAPRVTLTAKAGGEDDQGGAEPASATETTGDAEAVAAPAADDGEGGRDALTLALALAALALAAVALVVARRSAR